MSSAPPFYAGLLEGMKNTDLHEAAKVLDGSLVPEAVKLRPEIRLVASDIGAAFAAEHEVDAGKALALSLPNSVAPAFTRGFVREWFRKDPETVSHWINGLTEEAVRTAAVEELVIQLEPFDAEAAIRWRETLKK